MTDLLSKPDIIRWLNSIKDLENAKKFWEKKRELPFMPMCKAICVDHRHIARIRDGTEPMSDKVQRRLSRFIRDWEAGMLEFGFGKKRVRHLIHRETPRPRAMRMTVSWQGGAKLTIAQRPPVNPNTATFKDLFAGLRRKI